MSRIFAKLPFAADQLLEKLQSKGLIVKVKEEVIHCLETVGYYRLSAYFLAFKNTYEERKPFKQGTTFEDILSLYSFDKELRLLVLDPIETIEITLRSALTNTMSLKYGTHWYLDPDRFNKHINFSQFLSEVNNICTKRKEVFLKHYYKNYDSPQYPPSWMMMECLSFGTCSQLLMNIRTMQDRKEICKLFKHHPTIIESWFSALSYTRNLCAHHSRFWNRWFTFVPMRPHEDPILCKKHTFCEQATVIARMLDSIAKAKSLEWKGKLFNLFEKYPNIPKQKLGFLFDWKNDPFWGNSQSTQTSRKALDIPFHA